MTSSRVLLMCVLFVGLLGLPGCGNYEDRIPVTGAVTFNGEPLQQGFVSFVGSEGYSVASGPIQDGRYSLSASSSRPGIDPGEYAVRIESWEEEPGETRADGTFSNGKSAIPGKYQDASKSGLTAKVTDKDRRFDFELTDK